jgi:hypothetical protein
MLEISLHQVKLLENISWLQVSLVLKCFLSGEKFSSHNVVGVLWMIDNQDGAVKKTWNWLL